MIRAIALAALVGAACKEPDPKAEKLAEIARRSNVIVRADVRGHTLSELERLVAIPLERALAGIPKVIAIDTTIRGERVEIALTIPEGDDARITRRDVETRLATATLPDHTRASSVLASTSGGAIRLKSSETSPGVIDVPGVYRVRTCGPDMIRELVIDPAKLTALNVTIDDVLDAAASSSATLPNNASIEAVASARESDRSDCHVVVGMKDSHLASIHHEGVDFSEALYTLRDAGWSLVPMLGGQVELVLSFDGVTGSASDAIRAVAMALREQTGIGEAIGIEERGPPQVGRIIFRPAWDAKVREATKAAVAAVPGVRVLEVVTSDGQRAVAMVTGDDREAVIGRARAALVDLLKVDPEGGAGCIGCDQRAVPELRVGEAATENTARIAKLVGDGLEITSNGAPVRLRIDRGAELAPESVGTLPVRTPGGTTAPLASVGDIAIVPHPTVLLRHDGKPAVLVWKRPWNSTIGGAQQVLEKAFPGILVRTEYNELW